MDGRWATKSNGSGLIGRAISFQDFQPMCSWATNSYRRTDGRHAIAIPRFSASRDKNQFSAGAQHRSSLSGPSGGAYRTIHQTSSRLGRGHPLPIPFLPRRLRRLDIDSVPTAPRFLEAPPIKSSG